MARKILLISDPLSSNLNVLERHCPGEFSLENFFADLRAEWEDQKTVAAIAKAWRAAGFEVEEHEMHVRLPDALATSMTRSHTLPLVHSLVEGWGTPSREAWVPSLCECLGIPWIGSSVSGMTLSMDKDLVLRLARDLGIPTPQGGLARSFDEYRAVLRDLGEQAHFIKPNSEGSGMGIDRESVRDWKTPLRQDEFEARLARHPDGLRIEGALSGRELTTALVGTATFLPIAEIEVPGSIYGLEHKRKDVMTEKVTFPTLPVDTVNALEHWSKILWQRLDLRDMARFDWRCDESGRPHLLEVNPLPGLSPYYSVLPLQWAQTGQPFESLLQELARSALEKEDSRLLAYGRSLMRPGS